MLNSQRAELILAINVLIKKYESTNPDVAKDLIDLRGALETQGTNLLEYANTALRAARLIEWLIDHIPPY